MQQVASTLLQTSAFGSPNNAFEVSGKKRHNRFPSQYTLLSIAIAKSKTLNEDFPCAEVIAYLGFLLLNDPVVGKYHFWSEPLHHFWERPLDAKDPIWKPEMQVHHETDHSEYRLFRLHHVCQLVQ